MIENICQGCFPGNMKSRCLLTIISSVLSAIHLYTNPVFWTHLSGGAASDWERILISKQQNNFIMAANLPFCQMVRSSGMAEPWTHSHEESKFDQFGWRCTTNESGFGISTLVGNYNEEKFDLQERLKSKPLPSQVSSISYTCSAAAFDKEDPFNI